MGEWSFGTADSAELPQIVRLLADDDLGATRESVDPSVYGDAFAEIDEDPNNHLIVGRSDGNVVSTMQLTILPSISLQGAKRGQFESVRVASGHRGTGIGTAMCRWAIEYAQSKGCRLIQLTTDKGREGVVDFYENLGFVVTHHGLKLPLETTSE